MPAEFSTRRVQVNGIAMQVVDEGQGDAVLLLHGFPDSSRLWRHQIPALVEAGYRVLAPDLRGFGASDKPQPVEQYQFQTLLGDALGVLDQAGVERAHVIGHDWGAFVAWAMASFVPARVASLTVLSVAHPQTVFGTLSQYQKSWYMLLFQFTGVAEEALQRDDWSASGGLRAFASGAPDLESYIADLSRPGALTAGLNWYRANATPAVLFGLGEPIPWQPVKAPTLGVWSTGDIYLDEQGFRDSGQYIAGPYRYERIEDASHWIPLDQPERLNQLLLDFLGSAS